MKKPLLFGTSLAAILLLAGCGGGGLSDEDKTATAAVPTATARAAAAATAQSQAQATATAVAQPQATPTSQAEVLQELRSFYAGLPDSVKRELEAGGWPEERVNRFLDEVARADLSSLEALVGLFSPPEDIARLFAPLSEIPIPPLADPAQVLLNELLPAFLEPALVQQLGQQAFDELKAGSRPPTGGDFLAVLQFFSQFLPASTPTPVPSTDSALLPGSNALTPAHDGAAR